MITRVGPRTGLTDERVERVGALIETRGRSMLLIGRGTPGLRTITAVAAGTSRISARRALPPLLIGATIFVQLHLVLGVVLAGTAAYWLVRRGRRRGDQSWCEAAGPVCLRLAAAVTCRPASIRTQLPQCITRLGRNPEAEVRERVAEIADEAVGIEARGIGREEVLKARAIERSLSASGLLVT